jgi:hypothetical protein
VRSIYQLYQLTGLLNPRKDPKKVRGREIPNQRQSRASRVVKGTAAEDLAPHSNKLRKKKTLNTTPGTSRAVIKTLLFQRRPPITG